MRCIRGTCVQRGSSPGVVSQETWMVEERLATPLPKPWIECYDEHGALYYYNPASQ